MIAGRLGAPFVHPDMNLASGVADHDPPVAVVGPVGDDLAEGGRIEGLIRREAGRRRSDDQRAGVDLREPERWLPSCRRFPGHERNCNPQRRARLERAVASSTAPRSIRLSVSR